MINLTSESGQLPTTYINASLIKFSKFEQQFIAAAAPKTIQLFLLLVITFTVQIQTIVMLTELVEEGKRKADQYWPDRENMSMTLTNGITLEHVTTSYQVTFLNR